ncbi:fatty acid desaturase [Xenorhabdus cabanillasii]|uniref:fatty acid desaturase n=1 Tax=Xenorhabdus cabanillasii TaxID=351673 RepID=UPI001FD5710B|nr:fatty acid desaturase [Xenorhabdus cabanillasii]
MGTLLNIIPNILWSLFSWRGKLSKYDSHFENLISKDKVNSRKEINQLRLDRLSIFVGLLFFFSVSWEWALLCYLPSILLSFILVNIQNYYEHYGANPENKFTNSVSYYGRLYNLLAFNDGYHQEHHISGGTHWSQLPKLRERYYDKFKEQDRIISPVSAILVFLHIKRRLLHKNDKNKG